MRFVGPLALTLFLVSTLARSAHAQSESEENPLSQRLDALELKLESLKSEREAAAVSPSVILAPVPLPQNVAADPSQSQTFLGPAASKIYFHPELPWTFGVATEFFSFARQGDDSRTNVTSLAPTFGLRLHHRLIFNSQILLENGGAESNNTITVQKGQAIVQMAYLDWMFTDNHQAGMRIGHQLIPVGQINTLNEPTTYFSVQRPELEREVIPANWHENGLLFWVERPRATLEAGVFNSLNAQGLREETFLSGGRSGGQNAPANNLMGVFRLNAKLEHATLGGAIAFGNMDQGLPTVRNGAFQLSEAHARLHWTRFEATAMSAMGQIQDADSISILNSTVFPEQVRGSSVQAAGELLGSDKKLWLFSRFSHYNLHDRVADGYSPNPALNKTFFTSGLAYYPLSSVVVKFDYQHLKTPADRRGSDGFDIGVGLVY